MWNNPHRLPSPSLRRGPSNGTRRGTGGAACNNTSPVVRWLPSSGDWPRAVSEARLRSQLARCVRTNSVSSPRTAVDGAGWRARSRRSSRALPCAAIVSRGAVVTRRVSRSASVARHVSRHSRTFTRSMVSAPPPPRGGGDEMSDGCVEVAQPPPPSVSRPSVEARTTAHGRACVARRVTTPRPLCASWPAQVISHVQCLGPAAVQSAPSSKWIAPAHRALRSTALVGARALVGGRARSLAPRSSLEAPSSHVASRSGRAWQSIGRRSRSRSWRITSIWIAFARRALWSTALVGARALVGGRARSLMPRSSLGAPSSYVASHGGRAQHPPLSSGVRRRPTGGDREGDAARAAPAAPPRRAQHLPTRVSGKQMRQAQHPAHPPGVRSNSPRGFR